MEKIAVEDNQISYSSTIDDVDAVVGLLNGNAWQPETSELQDEYLQFDFSSPYDVKTVVVQGAENAYVSKFYVKYLREGVDEQWQTVNGIGSKERKVAVLECPIIICSCGWFFYIYINFVEATNHCCIPTRLRGCIHSATYSASPPSTMLVKEVMSATNDPTTTPWERIRGWVTILFVICLY